MKLDFSNTRIFLRPGATDMRKGSEGLIEIVRNNMKLNHYDSGCVFVFCSRNRKILKAVWWEKNGFWIAGKTLQEQTWPWPKDNIEAMEIDTEKIKLILCGIDVWKEHKALELNI